MVRARVLGWGSICVSNSLFLPFIQNSKRVKTCNNATSVLSLPIMNTSEGTKRLRFKMQMHKASSWPHDELIRVTLRTTWAHNEVLCNRGPWPSCTDFRCCNNACLPYSYNACYFFLIKHVQAEYTDTRTEDTYTDTRTGDEEYTDTVSPAAQLGEEHLIICSK